ncbi:MAG: hypothetical protein V4564_23715 [Pseudomonadota bacterium]
MPGKRYDTAHWRCESSARIVVPRGTVHRAGNGVSAAIADQP